MAEMNLARLPANPQDDCQVTKVLTVLYLNPRT